MEGLGGTGTRDFVDPFRTRLFYKDKAACSYRNSIKTRDKILWKCPIYAEERGSLLKWVVREGGHERLIYHGDIVSNEVNFAEAWHRIKRAEEGTFSNHRAALSWGEAAWQ